MPTSAEWAAMLDRADVKPASVVDLRERVKPKGVEPTRRQAKDTKASDDGRDERDAKTAVWALDKGCCRWCRRKVERVGEPVDNRAEFHHVSGRRVKAIRWDIRNLMLLCLGCHAKVTGVINERWRIVSKHLFDVDGKSYINARRPVQFERAA